MRDLIPDKFIGFNYIIYHCYRIRLKFGYLFLYYGISEVVLLPDGSAVNPLGYSVSQYFEWVKDPYEWFDQEGAEAAVYVP